MTEKGLIKFDSLPEKNFGGGKITFDREPSRKHKVLKKEQRAVGPDFDYIPTDEDKRLIASLDAKIEKIKFNLEHGGVIMTPGDKLREKERQESASKTDKLIQDIFGNGTINPKDSVSVKKTSRIGRIFGEVKRIFTEPRRLRSLLGAGIAAVGIVRATSALAESTDEIDTTTTIKAEGEMLSQNSDFIPGGNGGGGSEVEVAVSPIEITDEYKREVVDQIMDFRGPEIAPIPTEKIRNIFSNWVEEKFGPYRQELKDLGAENEKRIIFGAKSLFAYDNSGKLEAYNANDDKFQNHILRQEIIDFVLTGNHEDVFVDKNGNMAWIITADKKADKKIKKGFKDAIDRFAKNGIYDALESACNNGFCILFSSKTQPENNAGATFFNQYGVIWQNFDSKNIGDVKIVNIETRNLLVEPPGIIYLQYCNSLKYSYDFGNWFGLTEFVKDSIASCVALTLDDKDGLYQSYGESFKGMAQDYLKDFSISEADGKRQIQFIAEFTDPVGYDSLLEVRGFRDLIDLAKK